VAYIKYGIELFESYANSQGIGLYFTTRLNAFKMDFDPENLQKILNNLISNAIKFTPHGGGVTIELDHVHLDQKDLFRIQVQDTGIGIPENEIPFIFDRFYQASHTQISHHEGSGIGLALTKELIHLMEGDIQIKSEVEQGTSFIIHLPVFHRAIKNYTKVEDQRNEEKPQSNSDILPSESTLDEPRILLIEDNKDVLHYLKICLIERFTIMEAVHGSQGIALAFEQVPDLIITDVMMPGMDGFEVCDKLKNDPRTSHIPVIMLTAKATLQDKITGLKAGADAYLVKPFNVDELTAQVENLLTFRKKLQEKYNHIQEKGSFENYTTVTDKLFLDKLNEFIEKELINPELSVEKICDEMHMSRTQLHRKIKALTDRSITAYVRRYKLMAAQELIRKTDKTISEIAYETGFNDPSYFHRSFHKEFGTRPGDFRNTDQ
jgi:DNA-binding response OmpR family regulator